MKFSFGCFIVHRRRKRTYCRSSGRNRHPPFKKRPAWKCLAGVIPGLGSRAEPLQQTSLRRSLEKGKESSGRPSARNQTKHY